MGLMEIAIQLPGYYITEQLYAGTRTLVYRAKREADRTPVVIKLMRNEHPRFSELVQFRNQYTIAKHLDLPGIVKPYSLEPYRNGYALLMPDGGGISLAKFVKEQRLPIPDFLPIALQLADILNGLYRHRVIHKDLKPANILIHSDKQIEVIDFSIASLLPREMQEIESPSILEGTLGYMSPEQTGRMNRGIDYRSDFYSLGVTFFELLVGQLPFQSNDPMELVHCHIAKVPPHVHSLNPDIPPALSAIVSKLMAKNAEDRYQSALGLKHDLEQCLKQWQNGKIDFELGTRDVCDRFFIPEKLYGREAEVKALLAAFERVSGGAGGDFPCPLPYAPYPAKSELILVAGFSGVGKTAVVNEIHKPIVRQRGYFIKGKFDQFQRDIPFAVLVQAFRDLVGQLLSESDAQLEQWKSEILSALGENGQVVINVIPELEHIVGQQPSVAALSDSAAQNRFELLFQKFIQVFTTRDHPLVIFLDDLQWADSATLQLMKLLMSEDTRHLLLIGAYRDNEVFPAHGLMLTLEEIQKTGATVNTMTLAPLAQSDLNELIADTLHCSLASAEPLTRLVHQKTKGNPFFSHQFLKALHEDALITFDYEAGCWQCDLAQIKASALTDDVVEFMALQLQKLPENTQNVLKLAACIGNQFDLGTLAIVHEKSQIETAADLWQALQEGLILPTREIYKFHQFEHADGQLLIANGKRELAMSNWQLAAPCKFLHDRVQQAAYSLISENRRQSTHLKIGQLLLKNIPKIERGNHIFDIVNQLNIGRELISDRTERNELIQLNLTAGCKAKAATAYAAAVKYLTTGRELLAADNWHQYDLTLQLYLKLAEAEYLSTNFEEAERLGEIVLQQAQTLLDRVEVYETQIQIYTARNQLVKAVDTALQTLEMLGFSLSDPKDGKLVVLPALADLDSFPVMTDLHQLAVMRILGTIFAVAYAAKPDILQRTILAMVNFSIARGHSAQSAFAYVVYGWLLCGTLGEIDAGYHAGKLAIELLEQFDANSFKCKVNLFFNIFIRHWKEHIRATIVPLREGIYSGLDTGDLEYASYHVMHLCTHLSFVGEQLELVERQQKDYITFLLKIEQVYPISVVKICRQLSLNLIGQAPSVVQLSGDSFDEVEMLPALCEASNYTALFIAYVAKEVLSYLFQDRDRAIVNACRAEEYASAGVGWIVYTFHKFYYSLILLAQYPHASTSDRQQYLSQVEANQEQMKLWAHHAPMNYQHKYDLVEAEKARVLGKSLKAMDLYDRALAGAKYNEYLNEEALANELAAKFYLELGKEHIAQVYLLTAYYAYAHWGAKAKVDDLEQCYSQLLAPVLQQTRTPIVPHETVIAADSIVSLHSNTDQTASLTLDLTTVLKASQTLSGEIQMEKLLTTLLQVTIENAGADKGALMLLKDGKLVVEAIATVGQQPTVLQSLPLEDSQVPMTLVNFVKRTLQPSVTIDSIAHTSIMADPYIVRQQPQSLLCHPILHQGKLLGILYLENNLTVGAFTSDRVEILNLLCTQAAISLENARLYQQAQNALEDLQQTQIQLVENEKMSALGNLVAGVAHEINNPVGFIAGNIEPATDYVKDLFGLIDLYQEKFPNPGPEIEDEIAAIDLDYLREDLPKLIGSMREGTDRILNISTSLRIFSRADKDHKVPFNLHEGIDSTILILKHRLKDTDSRPAIRIVKDYGKLPPVECFAGQLNQVFMNLLANAIDALEAGMEHGTSTSSPTPYSPLPLLPLIPKGDPEFPTPSIRIRTEVIENDRVVIRIADNGPGMSETVKQQIFDYLFTTKPVGHGTGLGLAIAHQIVVDKHQGRLEVNSTLGRGAEFVITLPVKALQPPK